MSEAFDPYHKWLGIKPKDQPPNHYRLLSIELYEDDPEVIESAADRQAAHIRTFQNGPHSALSQKLLNEIAAAKLCLLKSDGKPAYDRQLKAKLERSQPTAPAAAPLPTARRAAPVARPAQPAPAQPTPAQSTPPQQAPTVSLTEPSSAVSRTLSHRKKPVWQQPPLLAAAALGVLVVVGIVLALGRDDRTQTALEKTGNQAESGTRTRPEPTSTQTKTVATPMPPVLKQPAPETGPADSNPKQSPKPDPSIAEVTHTQPAGPQSVRPPPATDSQSIDLLKLINPNQDAVRGTWGIDQEALLSPSDEHARIRIPYQPPTEYVFEAEIERLRGTGACSIGLVVGGHQVLLSFDAQYEGQDGFFSGLHILGGQPLRDPKNPTRSKGQRLTAGDVHNIRCIIRAGQVFVTCDDKGVVNWKGEARSLSVAPIWSVGDATVAFLATYQTVIRFSNLKLTPLTVSKPSPPETVATTKPLPPGDDEAGKFRRSIRSEYSDEFRAARQAEQKSALADSLLQEAVAEEDAARKYVLLVLARDQAVAAVDLLKTLQVTAAISNDYDVDRWELDRQALSDAAIEAKSKESRGLVAQQAIELADEARTNRAYDAAIGLVEIARRLAQRSGERVFARDMEAKKKVLAAEKEVWLSTQLALDVLQSKPDDPDANLAVGRFRCFVEDDWKQGLPMLAQGSHAGLRAAAKAELSVDKNAADLVAIGDRWHDLAQSMSSPDQEAALLRAGVWYRQALPMLTGPELRRTERRLEKLDAVAEASSGPKFSNRLAGRVQVNGSDLGTLLTYQIGAVVSQPELVSQYGFPNGFGAARKRIELIAVLRVPKQMDVSIRHAGGSSSGGVNRLSVNGKEVSAVGDDRNKDSTFSLPLAKGDYAVRWVLTGGSLGSSNRLLFFDPDTNSPLPVFFTPEMLATLRSVPTTKQVEIVAK